MDAALGMGFGQTLGDFARDMQQIWDRERTCAQLGGEGFPTSSMAMKVRPWSSPTSYALRVARLRLMGHAASSGGDAFFGQTFFRA